MRSINRRLTKLSTRFGPARGLSNVMAFSQAQVILSEGLLVVRVSHSEPMAIRGGSGWRADATGGRRSLAHTSVRLA